MLENSKDLLYIVLSFCVLWLTVFLCWLIYYAVSILRNTNDVLEEFRERARGIEEALRSMRDRLEHATSNFGFVSEGVIKLVQYFISKKRARTEEENEEERPKKKKK